MNESYLQNLSHSMVMTLLEAPWLMMKLFNASTFTPATRRTTPTIGCSRLGQRVRMRTSSDTALDGGEARVEPALHQALLHEPVQLALGQHRMHEVHLPEGLDVHLAQSQGVLRECKGKGLRKLAVSGEKDGRNLQPVVLFVAVVVLGGAQRVRDSFDGVDDRTGEVVGRVGLVLGAGPVVRRVIESVGYSLIR